MSDKDLGQSLENMEEGIENLKNKEFRVFGIKVTVMTASAAFAVVSSVVGALYGGFLMYQKVEQAIAFVEQQTEYEEKIAGFKQKMELMEKELAATKGSVQESTGYANEIKNDLKGDIRRLENNFENLERSNKQSIRENEKMVNEVKKEVDTTLKEVRRYSDQTIKEINKEVSTLQKETDRELKTIKKEIDAKIKQALDNPLADGGK